MAVVPNNDIARAIYFFLRDKKEKDHGEALRKVVKFLFSRRLLSQSNCILEKLDKIINQEEKKVAAKIWSASVMGEGLRKEISIFLKKRYGAEEVLMNEMIDESLLGGMKIEVEDEVIDLTIKDKFKKLKDYLINKV